MYNIFIVIGVDIILRSFTTSGFALLCCFHIQASRSLLESKSLLCLIRKGAENTVPCRFSLPSRIHQQGALRMPVEHPLAIKGYKLLIEILAAYCWHGADPHFQMLLFVQLVCCVTVSWPFKFKVTSLNYFSASYNIAFWCPAATRMVVCACISPCWAWFSSPLSLFPKDFYLGVNECSFLS